MNKIEITAIVLCVLICFGFAYLMGREHGRDAFYQEIRAGKWSIEVRQVNKVEYVLWPFGPKLENKENK